ncbi:DinB family protein [Zobellia sp. B3R18]|uniref:DinB family protein n=1 Tax=Zobellia sp. B3R18 TaxID=2841568 RepID=UPI001C06D4D7|nr:DinB family protein [Zobellia sp. B3R18]MBU2972940.1 DinB family protein [Zobellia sp. B3R18]
MKTSELKLADPIPFYKTYIDVLGEVELLDMLERQLQNFPDFIKSISESKLSHAYEVNKWTVAQVLLHIIDSERVFQYRALRFSRGDETALPGFDENIYASNSNAEARSKNSLTEEYIAVRKSTITLYKSFTQETLQKTGVASNLPWNVAVLGFVICGHQKHHRNILRERYLL